MDQATAAAMASRRDLPGWVRMSATATAVTAAMRACPEGIDLKLRPIRQADKEPGTRRVSDDDGFMAGERRRAPSAAAGATSPRVPGASISTRTSSGASLRGRRGDPVSAGPDLIG